MSVEVNLIFSNVVYLDRMPGSFLPGVPSRWSAIVEDSAHAIWAANDSAGLFRAANPGDSLIASNTDLTSTHILSMAIARNGILFAGSRSDGLFRSTDGGATWHSSGLAGERVQVLTAGKGSEVYAGTSNGVRISLDDGLSWMDVSTGLDGRDIRALAVGVDGEVYCGTWGEGVYRLTGAVEASAGPCGPEVPRSCRLEQNYPNPFNPFTTIKYTVGVTSGGWQVASEAGTRGSGLALSGVEGLEARKTMIVVYDVLGRQVATLVNEVKPPGNYEVTFDGSNLASGVYFYRMEASSFVTTKKLLLIR